jgi:hypothetical protein
MDFSVSVAGTQAPDELRSLYSWLMDEPELRGRVRLVERPPEPGVLGSVPELLQIAAGPGAAAALASAVIAWIRHRTTDVVYRFTRPDGTVIELSAARLRRADLPAQQQLLRDLAASPQTDPPAECGDQCHCGDANSCGGGSSDDA